MNCLSCDRPFNDVAPTGITRKFCPGCARGDNGSRCACGCGYVCRSGDFITGHRLKADDFDVTPAQRRYLQQFDDFILNWRDRDRPRPDALPGASQRHRPPGPALENDPLHEAIGVLCE